MSRSDRSSRAGRVALGLSPALLFAYLLVTAPAFLAPMFDTTRGAAGLPLGLVILSVAAVFTFVGVAVLWSKRMVPIGCLVLLLCTAPAVALVLLGPAICIIAREMTT